MTCLLLALACKPVDDGNTAPDDSTIADSADSADTADSAAEEEGPDCSGGTGGEVGYSFYEVDGHSYWLYLPPAAQECAPLLLFGHGGNQNGTVRDGFWQDMMGTLLPYEAEERGFAFMIPFLEDVDGPQEHGWDLGLVDPMVAMIEDASARFDIDRNQVMFAGTSAGGHMACYWGLYEPRGITAVTVMSAGIGGYFDYPETEPDPKLPFIVGHDEEDEIVPYRYSKKLAKELEAHGHEYVFHTMDLGPGGHGWTHEASTAVLDSWLE